MKNAYAHDEKASSGDFLCAKQRLSPNVYA